LLFWLGAISDTSNVKQRKKRLKQGDDLKNGKISVKDVPKKAESILKGKSTYPKGILE
jgi:hypothetical protein